MEFGKVFVRSSFVRVFTQLAQIGVAFFLMPFLIGELGDRWYGIWVIIAGLTGYYYLLDFGLSAATSRFAAAALAEENAEQVNKVVSTAFFLFALLGLLVMLVSLLLAYGAYIFVSDPGELKLIRSLIIIQGVGLGIGFSSKAFGGLSIAHMRFDLLSLLALARVIIETTAIFWFLSKGYGVLALVIIGFFSIVGHSAADYALARYLHPDLQISTRFLKRELVKDFFGFSIWSFIISLSNSVREQIDSAVIGLMLGTALVTHYNVGARLAMYALMLLNRATDMFTPFYTRLFTLNDRDGLREKYLLMTKLNSMISVIGGGLLILLGEAFIRRWMGADYLDGYPVLAVLSVALIAQAISYPSENILLAIAKHRTFAIITLIEAVVNVVLSVILSRQYGIVGVALGTVIPLTIVRLIIIPIYTCRQLDLSVATYYLSILPIVVTGSLYALAANRFAVEWISVPEYPTILISMTIIAIVYTLFMPFVGLNKEQRASLASTVLSTVGLSRK